MALGATGALEASSIPEIAVGSGLPAVFAAAMALPLAQRGTQPLVALAACLCIFGVQEVWGEGTLSEAVVPFVTLVVAMYSAGARLRGRALGVAVVASALALGGTILFDAGGLDTDSLVYALVVVATAFVGGRLVGVRIREADRLAVENAELEAEREERERAAVARERMRIAHELHDLITHRVSAMVLQASTERRIAERSGHAASETSALLDALRSIESLGREAMADLRQLLGALFHEGDDLRTPQPGVGDLHRLVEQTSATGVSATLTTAGRRRALPKPLEVSLYRLAQEALSNAMRHAPGASVSVALDYQPEAVVLLVTNTPAPRPDPRDSGLGLGIPGMRERVRQFGGSLHAGVTPSGGYEVRATLPTAGEPVNGMTR